MKRLIVPFVTLMLVLLGTLSMQAAQDKPAYDHTDPRYSELADDQFAKFPTPLALYDEPADMPLGEILKSRALANDGFNLVCTIIFLCAILHTFLAGYFTNIAHREQHEHEEFIEKHGLKAEDKAFEGARDHVSFKAHLFHFLGEVETVFGIWVIALGATIMWYFGFAHEGMDGFGQGLKQLEYYLAYDINFTEPLFVVIIMAIAATRPIIRLSERIIGKIAGLFGGSPAAWWLSILTIAPALGSFITEPAAMTIAAMLLAKRFFAKQPPASFAYATLGLLFVNISVGGTLTHFAAPPVLMVAGTWHWGTDFMLMNFGWKALIGIVLSNLLYFAIYKKHFANLKEVTRAENERMHWNEREDPIPKIITITHIVFLAFTVLTNHYPPLFIGGFMFFLGFTQATGHHQNDVNMKSPLLVGFFLAALVIHGKCQGWWIAPLITSIDSELVLMIGSTALTAFNDNAAITFLASQAPGLSAGAKYAIVAGAVTGGGLTVIANAPNPAGQSILGHYFKGGIAPVGLLKAALLPTLIVGTCFMVLPSKGMKEDPHPSKKPASTLSSPKKPAKRGAAPTQQPAEVENNH